MKIICKKCGKDINEIYQDNVSSTPNNPICENCFEEQEKLKDGCPNDCSLCGGYCVYDDEKGVKK